MSTDGITQRLRDDLEVAAQTLRRYEALHLAKGTPESAEKAEANAALAKRFEKTVRVFDEIRLAIAPELADTHAPIARITVGEGGWITGQHLYAPGLPPGEHDLWCVPVRAAEPDGGGPDLGALEHVIPPRFLEVACSQCGSTFGPGEHGFSGCPAHQGVKGPA